MTQEQREEIKEMIRLIEEAAAPDRPVWQDGSVWANAILPLARFARQQLNLRVDWRKFRELAWEHHGIPIPEDHFQILEALVMECLTTEPKEEA